MDSRLAGGWTAGGLRRLQWKVGPGGPGLWVAGEVQRCVPILLGDHGSLSDLGAQEDMVSLVSWNHPAELRDISFVFVFFLVSSHCMRDLSS